MITIKLKRDAASEWARVNPVLESGEPGYEKDTGVLKIGDGYTRWLALDYYLPSSAFVGLIEEALENAGAGDGGAAQATISAHIASLTPHSVYDDGPSLLLLYQNAKV